MPWRFRLAFRLAVATIILLTPFISSAQKPKLPKPRVLDRGVRLERDAATGELRLAGGVAPPGDAGAVAISPVIRSRVALVEVGCTVVAPDGIPVRGLTAGDFRLWEDSTEQKIANFDAASTPASIVLVLDASPSIYRELGRMRNAARSLAGSLAPQDQVAVVAFSGRTELLLPFSSDRAQFAAALNSPELARVADSTQSFIYQAVYLTAHELLRGRPGRKAIILLTDGQDSGLGLTWQPASMLPRPGTASPLAFEDVTRELAADRIELYAISTENRPPAMTDAWLEAHAHESLITAPARRMGIPEYTLYLAEMVRQVGGSLYFLRDLGSLAEVYRRIAVTLGAEYTLSYYPSAGTMRPGWRALRVDLLTSAAPAGARVIYRSAYYVPASP